jgi:hypothetical protein
MVSAQMIKLDRETGKTRAFRDEPGKYAVE